MSLQRRRDWLDVPSDPDPNADLGYSIIELDVLPTSTGGRSQTLVLPRDEDLLREDAFLVVDDDSVCDLERMV